MIKKWKTKCNGKVVRHGQVGVRIGKPNSPRMKSYCSRSLGIAKKFPSARLPCSRNYQSRRKWKCKIDGVEK
jgi:hypothetical protein